MALPVSGVSITREQIRQLLDAEQRKPAHERDAYLVLACGRALRPQEDPSETAWARRACADAWNVRGSIATPEPAYDPTAFDRLRGAGIVHLNALASTIYEHIGHHGITRLSLTSEAGLALGITPGTSVDVATSAGRVEIYAERAPRAAGTFTIDQAPAAHEVTAILERLCQAVATLGYTPGECRVLTRPGIDGVTRLGLEVGRRVFCEVATMGAGFTPTTVMHGWPPAAPAMSAAFGEGVERLRKLARLEAEGTSQAPEAHAVRDRLEAIWAGLTDDERERIDRHSADLREVEDAMATGKI